MVSNGFLLRAGLLLGLFGCTGNGQGTISVALLSQTSPTPALTRMADLATSNVEEVSVGTRDGSVDVRRAALAMESGGGTPGGPQLLVTVAKIRVHVKRGHGDRCGHEHDNDDHGDMADGDSDPQDGTDEGGVEQGDDGDDDDGQHDDGDDRDHERKHHKGHKGWVTVFEGSTQVDLFDAATTSSLLSGVSIPSGRLKEVRLVLTGGVWLVAGGTATPVRCPSCTTSGFKIKTHGAYVPDGGSVELTIVVDPTRSLSMDGSGYVLRPVIHVVHVEHGTCKGHDGKDHDDDEHDDDD